MYITYLLSTIKRRRTCMVVYFKQREVVDCVLQTGGFAYASKPTRTTTTRASRDSIPLSREGATPLGVPVGCSWKVPRALEVVVKLVNGVVVVKVVVVIVVVGIKSVVVVNVGRVVEVRSVVIVVVVVVTSIVVPPRQGAPNEAWHPTPQ